MQKFKSVEELINQLKPDKPVYCIRKNSILSASKYFQKQFPGKILYAVKTNPHRTVIKTLIKSGIDQFDVASIEEIKAVREFSQSAKCSYMHTVKSKESIHEAYFKHGIKTFALDTKDELIKIIMEENAKLHEDIRTLIPKIGNNNSTNSNNQSFNINFFLNETCKDAMNMKDFIENIKLTLENVIYASKNGVLDSSRKLIVQGLQDLELTERPIHCTDVKKNTMYIKDEGLWNMDKENENLKKILQNVSVKHMKGISEWIINNPYYMNTEGGQQEYVQMVKNITQDISGCKRDYKLTIKNICEETLVD